MVAGERRVLYFWHSVANHLLTTLCNVVADLNLTDMETCYKAFRTSLLQSIPIRSDRFGIEPELTIKVARRQVRIYEMPISYHGRTYEEGKKIGLKDAVQAVWVILRYALTTDIYKDSGPEILHALSGAPRFNRWMADTIAPYVGQRVLEIGAGIGNLTRHRWFRGAALRRHRHRLRAPGAAARRASSTGPTCASRTATWRDAGRFREPRGPHGHGGVPERAGARGGRSRGRCATFTAALTPGGRAIILVPHDQRIFGTLDMALGHYRRYSHDELRRRMEEAGFRVERILEFNRISRPAWHFSGRVLKRETLGSWQMRVFDRFVWLWRRIDSLLPWPPTSIIAIGVKA